MHHYSFPTNIRFGAGVITELPSYLKTQQLHKPLIVTDPVINDLPFFQKIIADLKRAGLAPVIFSEIHKNPIKSDVLAGKMAYGQNADCVVGIGGGAAMDVARAITLSIHHDRDLFDYDDLDGGSVLITEPVPAFITVPTTSGTGSEVGRAAIISEDDTKRKRILFHPKLLARQVFADPELTYDLPQAVTAATGMDALTHHMEAYIAKGFHPMCEGIALEGIRLIIKALPLAVGAPDTQSRSDMMIASLMGAVAFQKGLGIVHAISHPLSTLLDMHHGLANAVNLPYGMDFNYPVCRSHFQRMSEVMGLKKGIDIKNFLLDFNTSLGLPLKLKDCGVTQDNVDDLTSLATGDFCLPANPRDASPAEIKDLYLQAIG